MNRIRLLSEQVANQIAAGEVVERPASVVKELVENALDAQARRVIVEIQAGGRSLIRVTDDGVGMSRDDALLCLERHATSKIQNAHDLASISTMGFRGEALPSIASVSRMILTTREREKAEEGEGTQVVIQGGKILEVKAAGAAPGTCLEVRQLFFNLPARRKFLRSEETEKVHIQHYLTLAALAYPEVGFTFLQENRIVWQLPGLSAGDTPSSRQAALQERLRALHGAELGLLPVEFSAEAGSEAGGLTIWGFIGAPGTSRATRDEQHLFVNRRPVENRGLNFALLEGYHTALMKGRYPVCCLFLEINPGEVDVNIHPSKREVKFHREREVRALLAEAVRDALLRFHKSSGSEGAVSGVAHPSGGAPPLGGAPERSGAAPSARVKADVREDGEAGSLELNRQPVTPMAGVPPGAGYAVLAAQPAASGGLPGPVSVGAGEENSRAAPTEDERVSVEAPSASNLAAGAGETRLEGKREKEQGCGDAPLLKVPLRLIGVVGKLYVLLESDRGLVLLDQHAAHERILFEQMLRRMEQREAPSQRLLLPETVELSARDAAFLRENLGCLARLGVGLSEFGERTFLLDALPPFLRVKNARQFVLELLDELKAAGAGLNTWRLGEQMIAKTVCRHAVKANDPLLGRELENLVEDLRRCEMPYTCPHGRPTLIEMNYRELEKKFGRIQ